MRLVKLVQVISDLSCGILLTTAQHQGGNVSEKNVTEKVIKRGRIVPLASPHLPLLHNFQNATENTVCSRHNKHYVFVLDDELVYLPDSFFHGNSRCG